MMATSEEAAGTFWPKRLSRSMWISDLLVITTAVLVAQLLRMGDDAFTTAAGIESPIVDYWVVSVGVIAGWMLALRLTGTRSPRILGYGPEEFTAVLTASLWVLGMVSIASFALRLGIARGYVAIALPLGTVLLLASRWCWRRWLNRTRATGQLCSRVLAIATQDELSTLKAHLTTHHGAGIVVAEAVDIAAHEGLTPEQIASLAARHRCDDVLLGATAALRASQLRDLIWLLADDNRGVILASALTGITGRRARSRPVEGLPLWQVQAAKYSGGMWLVKEAFDRVGSALLLVCLSPLLLAVVTAIKLDSRGPVLFKQERIGVNGHPFRIWKFRSMHNGAHRQLPDLLNANGCADRPLFKIEDDPRITRVGRFLRRYSIDELPQLVNVLRGDMSIVGPRPQVPAEVALYDNAASRRLKTKPGMTGLWQVSGRSDLDWQEAVLLDLHYVDNWSLTLDAMLIGRTLSAVVSTRGAR